MGIETILIVLGVASLLLIWGSWARRHKRHGGQYSYDHETRARH